MIAGVIGAQMPQKKKKKKYFHPLEFLVNSQLLFFNKFFYTDIWSNTGKLIKFQIEQTFEKQILVPKPLTSSYITILINLL